MRGENYYSLLGVPINATPEEIKIAYRELVKDNHPDLKGKEVEPKMISLNNAYRTLKEPIARDEYNFMELLPLRKMPEEIQEKLPEKMPSRKGRPLVQTVMKKLTGRATLYTMTAVAIRFKTAMRYAHSPKPYHQERAIEELKKALELEPRHVDSIYNIGVLYCRLGELANGVYFFQKYLTIEKNKDVEDLLKYIDQKLETTRYDTKMLCPPDIKIKTRSSPGGAETS